MDLLFGDPSPCWPKLPQLNSLLAPRIGHRIARISIWYAVDPLEFSRTYQSGFMSIPAY